MKAILAIDQGTTSTRAIAFSVQGKKLYSSQLEFKQYFPKNGWVEHDPEEIWKTTKKVLLDIINKSKKLKILGDGLQKKSYLHVKDCISAIEIAINKSIERWAI